MPTYHVKWRVIETINGPGQHDGGVRDGDRRVAAEGEIDKEAESAAAIRADLIEAIRGGFPEHGLGPTYDIDRHYEIDITPVEEEPPVAEEEAPAKPTKSELRALKNGEYAAHPIGTTVVKLGDGSCSNRRRWRRNQTKHDYTIRPINVEDIDEEEMRQPGVAFPMATFVDELTCNRCGEVVVQKVRGLL